MKIKWRRFVQYYQYTGEWYPDVGFFGRLWYASWKSLTS
jgi:hypothetical protein